jgi:hypothetical protein
MDTKANLAVRRKLNELAMQHNRLTTLCAFLLNEVSGIKKQINDNKSNGGNSMNYNPDDIKVVNTGNNNSSPNFSELKADEILKQLSINNLDN